MTVRIVSGLHNRETHNAEKFRNALLESAPQLDHPDVAAEILCNLPLPERELDLVLLYHDTRPEELQLRTSQGKPIHSFVLIVEVKQHSPDLIRFEGPKVKVRYDRTWRDATDQCDAQTFALKKYQEKPYWGKKRRQPTFVQRAIWLARASKSAFEGIPATSSVPVYFNDLRWQDLVDQFRINNQFDAVRTFVDNSNHPIYHNLQTIREVLVHEVLPTRIDLRRVNALTQTRFDADKTAYIQNLGNGLLTLRGRGGTGKTFALVQIALHLARQGKSAVILTYNHGLIADISRALRIIENQNPNIEKIPKIQTRYSFIQDVFVRKFGDSEEKMIRNIPDIEKREEARTNRLKKEIKEVETGIDFALIDEGQDWATDHRDFVYRLFGPGRVVVADGVDQFVGKDRCNWDNGDIPINRRHSLRASRRTKAATCQTIAEIAHELGVSDWDLEPDPNTHGGRFTVLVEPNAPRAVERGLSVLEADQREEPTLRAVDNLVCLPSSKISGGINFGALFDKVVEDSARDSWRGFDEKDRRNYPVRDSQLRAIQYHSCRGMEGWTTLCLGLDLFFDYQKQHPRIDIEKLKTSLREKEGLFISEESIELKLRSEATMFAINWLMIPLTRSIDHLIIHVSDVDSSLGKILKAVSDRYPGSIEWLQVS